MMPKFWGFLCLGLLTSTGIAFTEMNYSSENQENIELILEQMELTFHEMQNCINEILIIPPEEQTYTNTLQPFAKAIISFYSKYELIDELSSEEMRAEDHNLLKESFNEFISFHLTDNELLKSCLKTFSMKELSNREPENYSEESIAQIAENQMGDLITLILSQKNLELIGQTKHFIICGNGYTVADCLRRENNSEKTKTERADSDYKQQQIDTSISGSRDSDGNTSVEANITVKTTKKSKESSCDFRVKAEQDKDGKNKVEGKVTYSIKR